MSVLTILDDGNDWNEKQTIEELYEQNEEKGTIDKFFKELLQSIETKKEVINPNISGLLYVWREEMLNVLINLYQ
jgi:transcription termination factor NusB